VGWWKRLLSRGFYWLFNRLSDVPIEPGAPDFFVLSRRAREALARMGDRRRFLRAMVVWIGLPRAHVAYVPPPRVGGRSKYTLGRMLRLASDALLAFSFAPLQLVALLGAAVAFVGGLVLAVGTVRGLMGLESSLLLWLSGFLSVLGGLQLGALGLVGAYVARIFEQSQGRPLYVLRQAPEELGTEPRVVEVAARPRRASR
jgi:dolichol-phosphate mannosyltransferase